jgi:hypothetical protein
MPVSPDEAARRYRRGIQSIGIQAYQEAAQQTNSVDAQRRLENAKQSSLNLDDLVRKYRAGYAGNSGGGGFDFEG